MTRDGTTERRKVERRINSVEGIYGEPLPREAWPLKPPREVERCQAHLRNREGVYFVKWGDYIKIGCAADVRARHRALVSSIPEGDVTPLAWIYLPYRGNPDLAYYNHELEIHYVLRDYRVRGEWFRDCPTLRRFIARYAKPWPWVAQR